VSVLRITRAPWPKDVIEALKRRQTDGRFHPYTCGNDSNHPPLVPTRDGWICESCNYTQNWFSV
jgi:hypothetical protein